MTSRMLSWSRAALNRGGGWLMREPLGKFDRLSVLVSTSSELSRAWIDIACRGYATAVTTKRMALMIDYIKVSSKSPATKGYLHTYVAPHFKC